MSNFQTYTEEAINSNSHSQHTAISGSYTFTGCTMNPDGSQYNSQDYEVEFNGVSEFSDGANTMFGVNLMWNQSAHRSDVLVSKGAFIF